MATQNSSLSVIERELSSALTKALVSTGLVEAEKKVLIMQNTRPVCTVTIIMCSQSTGICAHTAVAGQDVPP